MTTIEQWLASLEANVADHEQAIGRLQEPMNPAVAALFPPDHWSDGEKSAYLVGRQHGLRGAGSLDAAWRAAEEALPQRPDGGGAWDSSGGVGLSLNRLNARAYAAEWGEVRVIEDTPAAALLALAEALRDRGT